MLIDGSKRANGRGAYICNDPECLQKAIKLDTGGRANGRGAYLCNNPDCLQKAIKTKGLNRAFKMNIDADILVKLGEEMNSIDR